VNRGVTLVAFLAFLAIAGPVAAHPHILIDARMIVTFNRAGEVAAITHEWLFDPAFSAWQVQGLDRDGDGTISEAELSDLARSTVANLGPFRFYTTAGEGVTNLPLASMDDARMTLDDGRLRLVFGLEPQSPYPIKASIEIAVYDPEYYTAFTYDAAAAVVLDKAPAGCAGVLEPPRPLSPELEAQLYDLPPTLTKLPPELAAAMRGREGAVVISCTGVQP
jgi:nickel/cobalt exporter